MVCITGLRRSKKLKKKKKKQTSPIFLSTRHQGFMNQEMINNKRVYSPYIPYSNDNLSLGCTRKPIRRPWYRLLQLPLPRIFIENCLTLYLVTTATDCLKTLQKCVSWINEQLLKTACAKNRINGLEKIVRPKLNINYSIWTARFVFF